MRMTRRLAMLVLLVIAWPVAAAADEARIALGERLYFDPRLSFTGALSCNNCHNLHGNGADRERLSIGALGRAGSVNTPSLWDVAGQAAWFRDGRAETLEQAIAEHLLDDTVMAMPNTATLVARLDAISGYRALFAEAFPRRAGIDAIGIQQALAAYLGTLATTDAAFDRYRRGEGEALSAAAQRGLQAFIDSGCAGCHAMPGVAGPRPQMEVPPWRATALRNVALTAPYFHDGSVDRLDAAVREMAVWSAGSAPDERVVSEIVEFLEHLTGERPAIERPELP